MKYEDQVRMAVMGGLFAHFGVMPIDIVCGSLRYQQALGGTTRILAILDDEQKGTLFMEYQSVSIRKDDLEEIAGKIEQLKKHEFANADAIAIQERKMMMAVAEANKAFFEYTPKLLEMLNTYCAEYVHKNNGILDEDNPYKS